MKTLAIVALFLCGAAFLIRQNNITADPTGRIAIEKTRALNGGALPGTGLIADPTGTVALKMAQKSKLAQGN